jgi:acetyl esterase/lipase
VILSGGNLASILSMRIAKEEGITLPRFQLLVCPVIDNTATVDTVWAQSKHAPWLTPARMMWYRGKYFVNPDQAKEWTASPCFAPSEILRTSSRTAILVAEYDLLAPEALDYAAQLDRAGVETQVRVFKGATHSMLGLAGYCNHGQDCTLLLTLRVGYMR